MNSSPKSVSDSSEDEILSLVRRIFPEKLLKGFGITVPALDDDASVLSMELIGADSELVITADVLIEGEDFEIKWMSAYEIGFKSLMVNLSDLAAMGAEPVGMIAVVGVPKSFSISFVESFLQGLCEPAEKYNVLLLGGDLSASEKFISSITLLAKVPRGKALRRSGVKIGDVIAVTGNPGESLAGFEILAKKSHSITKEERIFTERFLRPQVRIDAGKLLCGIGNIRGCLDLSDGIARDLTRISRINNFKAMIKSELLPMSEKLRNFWTKRNFNPYEMLLKGGEDFELLFSCGADVFPQIKNAIESELGLPVNQIGEWIAGEGAFCQMHDGSMLDLSSLGFDHFGRTDEYWK